jgi:hypothetical protein
MKSEGWRNPSLFSFASFIFFAAQKILIFKNNVLLHRTEKNDF